VKAQLLRVKARVEQAPSTEFSPLLWIKLAAFQPLLAEPGTQVHYSNIGFEILGLIAVRASGQNIESLYSRADLRAPWSDQQRLRPAGPISGRHAHGYSVGPDGRLNDATAAHGGIGAEGAVISNAEDTARFLVSLMQGKLLGPKQLELMKQSAFWSGGNPPAAATSLTATPAPGAGFKTDVWVSGNGKRVAVLLLNGRGDGASDERAGAAMRRLYCAAPGSQPRD
jgi:CubicO group peptidase (beta-lactamase class C family)